MKQLMQLKKVIATDIRSEHTHVPLINVLISCHHRHFIYLLQYVDRHKPFPTALYLPLS